MSSQNVLIAITCAYLVLFVIDILWTLANAHRIDITNDNNTLSTERNIVVASLPILFYLLTLSTNISLILYFYESNNLHFCIASLILFVMYRIVTAVLSLDRSDSFKLSCLNFILDYDLYRSLFIDYICNIHAFQHDIRLVQNILVTPIQFIFCLILFISSNEHHIFIVWYSIMISSMTIISNAILSITHVQKQCASSLHILCYIFDAFGEIFIFTLLYLTMTYIAFYIAIGVKIVLLVNIVIREQTEIFYIFALFSVYPFALNHVDDHFMLHAMQTCFNLLSMILITIFACTQHNQSDVIYLLMIVAWVLTIFTPICAWKILQNDNFQHNTGYNEANRVGKLIEYRYFEHFIVAVSDLQEIIRDVMIDEELRNAEEEIFKANIVRLLLIGNENDSSCKVYKQLTSKNSYHSEIEIEDDCDYDNDNTEDDSSHNEYDNEYELSSTSTCSTIEINESFRLSLVYGFIHEFEGIHKILYLYHIPEDIIESIVMFYGFPDLCFCCYNKKMVQLRRETKQYIHIHKTQYFNPKMFDFKSLDFVIYCVSLSVYNEYDEGQGQEIVNLMHQSLNIFSEIINNYLCCIMDINLIVQYTDFELFEEKILNGISLNNCFADYDGDDKGVDEAFVFIQQKFDAHNTTQYTLFHSCDMNELL
eukprot:490075_1